MSTLDTGPRCLVYTPNIECRHLSTSLHKCIHDVTTSTLYTGVYLVSTSCNYARDVDTRHRCLPVCTVHGVYTIHQCLHCERCIYCLYELTMLTLSYVCVHLSRVYTFLHYETQFRFLLFNFFICIQTKPTILQKGSIRSADVPHGDTDERAGCVFRENWFCPVILFSSSSLGTGRGMIGARCT